MYRAVLFLGHMRAGKTEAAKATGFEVLSLATPLKQLYQEATGRNDKDRRWLQEYGAAIRRVFGEDTFANALTRSITGQDLAVDDVRYLNELRILHSDLVKKGYEVKVVVVNADKELREARGAASEEHESERLAGLLAQDDEATFKEMHSIVRGPLYDLDGTLPLGEYRARVNGAFGDGGRAWIRS